MTTTMTGSLPTGTTAPAPNIRCFLPKSNPDGKALIIFPGGGYWQLSAHEGDDYAKYFSAQGIACFVVDYRLAAQGHKHPAMIEDAFAAIYTVRAQADTFGIDPNKVGVCGSSAGGHLAATTMLLHEQYECDQPLRPDFGILCYSVIQSTGAFINQGSIDNLLGENPPAELLEMMACEKQVTPNTPPCFIWSTADDVVVPVENSLAFAAALSRNKVPYDLRIYDTGEHGLGLNTPYAWEEDTVKWMNRLHFNVS
ncbi:MAG: alpha/beta hydrolase [Opitutales bacterium]|nr:alpha/beta hydrolase [Opitutales bacterium]